MSFLSFEHTSETPVSTDWFASKADTLMALASKLTQAKVPPLKSFSVVAWQQSPDEILQTILFDVS